MKQLLVIILVGFFIGFSFGGSGIATGSMEPTLKKGDWTFNVLTFHPKIGDIITFYCSERCGERKFIRHRLTSIDPNGCMSIEGDNQPGAWDTRDYGCLMPQDVFIFAKSYPIHFN